MADPSAPEIDLKDRSVYTAWTSVTIYSDLDPNSHVNNGAVNAFFEEGRVALRRAFMGELGAELLRGFAIARFAATYHGLTYYPGAVDVGTVVTRIGNSSFGLGQGVFQGDRCAATAEVVSVYIDPESGKPTPLPPPIRAALEAGIKRP